MNDRELLYVKTIAETKSISEAAKKLFVAQPSLSQALQKIEQSIGTPLFIRHQGGMMLTLAGEKYYKAANEILNIYNDFTNEITYINDLKKGRVTIGITNFMGSYLLPKIIPPFNDKYPNIEIYITEKNSSILEQELLDCTIDFAIMHNHPKRQNKSILYDVLYKDPFVIVTKKGYIPATYKKKNEDSNSSYPKIDIRLLKDEKFIMVDKGKGIRNVCDIILDTAGINPRIALTTKSYETARRLASTGYGITMIPLEYIKIFEGKYDADYYFIDNDESSYWNTCIATNPNMYQSRVAKVFIELINVYFKTNQPI
ncbi:MAG: LysR family transcriptional regulator [Tissierella sp.]|nr:LysR family transcriptional regulator [Tissierella sp.]